MVKVIHRIGDLAVGDIVALASGGPDMTVVGFTAPEPRPDYTPAGSHVADDTPLVSVAWHTGDGVLGQARFPVGALKVKDSAAERDRPNRIPPPNRVPPPAPPHAEPIV